ncbi:MAG: NAD(P)H-hydrate dehydratase [Clostridia bacterium]|nr:NAD(P)H-hydrate dehydratase [Clostridia bacterium]
MEIATSTLIREIDAYLENVLGIPTKTLMRRAGQAVKDCVLKVNKSPTLVLILAGGGNNGGDGYAAALELYPEVNVRTVDLFSRGQRSEAGKYYLSECEKLGVVERGFESAYSLIDKADVIVDAIFGIGYAGELSEELVALSSAITSLEKQVVSVDIPLGVNADTGEVSLGVLRAEATAALCRYKCAHISYPARDYMGKAYLYDIGIDDKMPKIPKSDKYFAADKEFAMVNLPKRKANSNKGTYGHTLHITGSDKYVGASMLSLEASLRSGVGLVTHLGEYALGRELCARFPEVIYSDLSLLKSPSDIVEYSRGFSSILIGPGSTVNSNVWLIIKSLVESEGAPIIIDADGLNSIAEYSSAELFKSARRTVIITPHPREMSRLSGKSVEYINSHRISFSEAFAREYGVILLLKGAGTVVTDGEKTVINTSGSSALSKGGSGDVLSGIIASLIIGADTPLFAVALAAYLHGRAADTLKEELSELGVTPSDLPKAVAGEISAIIKSQKNNRNL